MKSPRFPLLSAAALVLLLSVPARLSAGVILGAEAPWTPQGDNHLKIGTGKADVTPEEAIPLWGFAARDQLPFESVYEPVHIKVLTLDDGEDRVIMLTAEILNWSRDLADEFRAALKDRYGLEPHQIILNASHTHCGPSVTVPEYRQIFISRGVDLVGQCLENAQPAKLYFGRGECEMARSRRSLHRSGFAYWGINL